MANKISEVKNDGKNKVLNTNNMCRMCLVQCSDDNLVDILDATDEISVTFRITSCAGLDVRLNGFKNKTKHNCITLLRSCHKILYQKKCVSIVDYNWKNHFSFETEVKIRIQNYGNIFD